MAFSNPTERDEMIGTRVGVYEITARLGAGGMGEVYRATDTQLKRQVALKVLPPEVAGDAERLARFQREAEVLAALNHPHIAQIYGVERSTDVFALVMELVEGEDLSERIATSNGRGIPLADALPIAKQIAEALEAAHEHGIIHRDLKPANIKVKDDGTVKVLDFGLAKAIERAGGAGRTVAGSPALPGRPAMPALTASPTITSPALMTHAGVILGTAAYMSPEQAKGRPADKRADVWAFGCVLYEMLTGTRAFGGDDVTETFASIVKDSPNLSAVPREVRRLLARCLEKDPAKRLRSIGSWDLLLDEASAAAVTPPRRRTELAAWIAAALFAAFATGLAVLHYRAQPVQADPLVVTLPVPTTGRVGFIALSPDGTRVVIRAGDQSLWLRPLNSSDPRKLTTSFTTRAPFWSPDSKFVAYFDGARLVSVPASGGPAQQLCNIKGAEQGGTWGAKGIILFGDDSGLLQVSAAGGACTPLARPSGEAVGSFPTFLPDGDHFFYVRRSDDPSQRGVYLASLAEPSGRRLLADAAAVLYAPPEGGRGVGHIIFRRRSELIAHPFDQTRLDIVGEPVRVAEHVVSSSDRASPVASVSDTGRLAWVQDRSELSGDSRLVWLDGNGKRLGEPLASGVGFVSLSPDNRFVVTQVMDDTNSDDLLLIDLSRGASTRLSGMGTGATFASRPSAPVWSPDSKHLLFLRGNDFYRKDVATGAESLVLHDGVTNSRFLGDWSRDGRYVFYTEVDAGTRGDIWYLVDPLGSAPHTVKFLGAESDENQPQLSPDGRWLMYAQLGATRDIFIRPFPSGEGRWKVSLNGGAEGRWTQDGKTIVFRPVTDRGLDFREFWAASFAVDRSGVPEIGAPKMLFSTPGGNSTPDRNEYRLVPAPGNRYLVSEYDDVPAPVLHLVTHWQALAPALVR